MTDGVSVRGRPKIAVIGAGGTISTRSNRGALDVVNYMADGTTMHVEELLSAIPEVHEVAEVVPVRFRAVSSTSMAFEDWRDLALAVHQALAAQPDLAGVVILHGTATLEETAYMLHLTVKVRVPVVLVGAQRPMTALSSDGPMNLVNALRVAGDRQARDMGVLVCLNDEVHAAREVTKSSTSRLHAFRSPDSGALGQIDGGAVHFYRRPLRRGAMDSEFDIRELDRVPRVDIAYAYAGDDGAVIRALTSVGAKGIVVAAFPGGRLSAAQAQACMEARRQGVAVALSTRAGSGMAMLDSKLQAMGLVAADNLNPQKARVLLSLALTRTSDTAELERMFATY
jgi:L-asparaginase